MQKVVVLTAIVVSSFFLSFLLLKQVVFAESRGAQQVVISTSRWSRLAIVHLMIVWKFWILT